MANFLPAHWLNSRSGPAIYPVEMTRRRALVLALLFGIPAMTACSLVILGLAPFWNVLAAGVLLLGFYEIIAGLVLRFGLFLAPRRVQRLTHAFAEENTRERDLESPGSALPVSVTFKAFANFEPKPMNEPALGMIIDRFGCRTCDSTTGEGSLRTIYLAGDCTFFDAHLKSEDSIVCHLERRLNSQAGGRRFRVVSAAFQHYVALHALVRASIHMQATPIDCVVLACGINDALAYLHTEGKLAYDFSNRYVSSEPSRIGVAPAWRSLLKYSRTARALYLRWGETAWDRSVYRRLSERRYFDPEALFAARRGFSTQVFEGHVSSLIGLCRHRRVPILLTTVKYKAPDMGREPRRFVAESLDRLNETIMAVGARYGVPVIKFHESIPDDDDFIFNKWHFTPLANRLRASLLAPEIMRLVWSENHNLQPLATTAT